MAVRFTLHVACSCAAAELTVTDAVVTEVGVYTADIISRFNPLPRAQVRTEGIEKFRLVAATTNISARIGTRFGFRYTVKGNPSNAPIILTMVGRHPPMIDPATGKFKTRDEYELRSRLGKTYTSFCFDDDWELVPGGWSFEVWYQGRKLCEQQFWISKAAK